MTKRQARMLAHGITAGLIEAQLESGEPDPDRWPELSEADIGRVRAALLKQQHYHERYGSLELP
jgi:hypothetical protein